MSDITEVTFVLDPYSSRNSCNIMRVDGTSVPASLGGGILSENICHWAINPFKRNEQYSLDRAVNDEYSLCLLGDDFHWRYLELLRVSQAAEDSTFCTRSVARSKNAISHSFEDRITMFRKHVRFMQLENDVDMSSCPVVPTIYVNIHTCANLECMLAQSSVFSQNSDGSWHYDPFSAFAVDFNVICVDEAEISQPNAHFLSIQDDAVECVDVHVKYVNDVKCWYHKRIVHTQNFIQAIRDYLTYTTQVSTFAALLSQMYHAFGAQGGTDKLLEDVLTRMSPSVSKEDAFTHAEDFICLDRVEPLYAIITNSPLEIRLGFSAKVQAVCLPRYCHSGVQYSLRPSKAGKVNVETTLVNAPDHIAVLKAVAEGEMVLSLYVGAQLRPAAKMTVIVYDKNYCKQIVPEAASVVLPAECTYTPRLTCIPNDAEDIKMLKWTSSDERVAKTDANGKIYAYKPGSCVITVAGVDVSTSIRVQVKPRISAIKVEQDTYKAYVNSVIPLKFHAEPVDCYDGRVHAHVTNPTIACFEEGQLLARCQGECDLILSSETEKQVSTIVHIVVSFMEEPPASVRGQFYTWVVLASLTVWFPYIYLLLFGVELFTAYKYLKEDAKNLRVIIAVIVAQVIFSMIVL